MSIRTIEAPGVEIKEIDKSAYTPAMTGTRCFVMGYSDKGEPYQPMQFTSKSAWQNYYGDPDNEAERYFYNACAEVINQNGVLYSARLPYDNKSRDKMVGFKFKVNTFSLENPTAGQYLSVYPIKSYVDHDDDFEKDALQFVFDNKCYREIDANLSNGYEYDKEIKFFYNSAFKAFKETYDKKEEFRRYAISYLSVDLEKTQELSARFLTFQEAKEYVDNFTGRGVKGKYQYVTVVGEKPTILRDCGDWIAQPLYCNFVKEAVTTEKYDGIASIKDIDDLVKEISSLPYGDTIPSDKFDKIDDIEDALNEILAKASFGTTDYERISDMLNVLTTTYKKPLDEGVEFPKYGYTNDRVKKLKAEHVEISIIDLYNKHQIEDPRSGATIPDEKWVIPAVYDIQVLNEGANNEWLFDTPVSAIYEDETMNLSANEDVSALYTSELWEEYKGRSLSSIIKTKQDVSFEDYVDFRLRDSSYNISSFQAMREIFKAEGNIKFQDVIDKYNVPKERVHADVPYYRIADLDGQLNNYLTIDPAVMPIMEELSTVDEYRTGESNVPANSFWVFDKTCATLNKVPEDERKGSKR